MNQYVGTQFVAFQLNVTTKSVRQWIAKGLLRAERVSDERQARFRITLQDYESFLEAMYARGGPRRGRWRRAR